MRQQLFTYIAFMLVLLSGKVHATPPSVVVDIAPLHSLVGQVMQGVAKPVLLIPAEASPHHYTLRPSEAKALANAELVFWMGESYTPWLEKALKNVAGSAQKIEMLAFEDTITYPYREGATFESHDHSEEEGHKGEEHHNDEKEHHDKTHDKQEVHQEKGDESQHVKNEEDHHEKGENADHHDEHEGSDPHAWLDPENAKRWVNHISDMLSKRDPSNASAYHRNAAKAVASLDALIHSAGAEVGALNNPKFIVFHDAYQYFEKRFGISATGSISLGHAQSPSPARIKEIRDTVKKLGVSCVFTEPQFNPGIVKNVFEGTPVSTIGVMDPLGARIPEGNDHYQALIKGMVNSLRECQ